MANGSQKINRRNFIKAAGLAGCLLSVEAVVFGESKKPDSGIKRPNVLWISTEDINADLGCYGVDYADTPNLDALAGRGVRYDNAFTHAGVCAPVRSGTITGMYPVTIGTSNMRCKGVLPNHVKCFTEYLRQAGYYCTNDSKTDYQFKAPASAWDECKRKAHYRGRAKGQPFFHIRNFTNTHESRIRNKYTELKHDPDKAKVPPYYPDTPVTRKDWARYHDNITTMDSLAQGVLDELEKAGLAEDTIVWFWGDHGRGLPRAKRWLYDSGMRIPLIVYVPPKYRAYAGGGDSAVMAAGTVSDDLVSSIDFAPTMLSLCGVDIPKHLQGKAFLGPQMAKEKSEYIFGARDRIDEAYDMVRAVNDKRFKYIRNFMPYVPYAVHVDYMNQMPTMQELRKLDAAGKLKGSEKLFMQKKRPLEELYDLKADKHETNNLAGDPKYAGKLLEMRKAVVAWMAEVGDVGLIPECDFDAMKVKPRWRKKLDRSDMLKRLLEIRQLDFEGAKAVGAYLARLSDKYAAVRYWAVVGLHQNCKGKDIAKAAKAVAPMLKDKYSSVQIAAAQALVDFKGDKKALKLLVEKLDDPAEKVRLFAATALDRLGEKALPVLPEIQAAVKVNKKDRYFARLLKYTVYRLKNKKELFS
ncbi:MAG: sulfatase-like hydrolase/transferase [Planctomycetes bacterium]|nr:sulfatase-like hydrolase/transferase [Planctomycetota bacterium]